ncbi:MAG: GFA family protein, partial [Rhodobacteraceae bacterium]|nr:GFA family protein [Paracoccaceae bacterium]
MTDPVKVTCHCGAVELRVTLSDGLATARRCDCSYCRRRGTPAVTAPLDGVEVVKGAETLTL